MKFILGLICGLVLGGAGYAIANHDGWNTPPGPHFNDQPGTNSGLMPQPFLDMQSGQIRQMMPLNPRNPC